MYSLRLFLAVSFACASQGVLIEAPGAMTTKAGVITLTQYNIDSMMGKYNYLMVNFCASWKKGCKVTEADFEKAAARLKQDNVGKDIALAYVNLTVAKALGRKFEITKVPQLKLFTTFGSETGLSVKFSAYKGKKDADAIYNHAKTTMDEAREGSNILRAEKKEGKITDEKKRAAYISVKEATAENFKQLISNPKEDVLLQLYDNKPLSAKLAPEYKQLAEMFQTAGIKTVRFTKVRITCAQYALSTKRHSLHAELVHWSVKLCAHFPSRCAAGRDHCGRPRSAPPGAGRHQGQLPRTAALHRQG